MIGFVHRTRSMDSVQPQQDQQITQDEFNSFFENLGPSMIQLQFPEENTDQHQNAHGHPAAQEEGTQGNVSYLPQMTAPPHTLRIATKGDRETLILRPIPHEAIAAARVADLVNQPLVSHTYNRLPNEAMNPSISSIANRMMELGAMPSQRMSEHTYGGHTFMNLPRSDIAQAFSETAPRLTTDQPPPRSSVLPHHSHTPEVQEMLQMLSWNPTEYVTEKTYPKKKRESRTKEMDLEKKKTTEKKRRSDMNYLIGRLKNILPPTNHKMTKLNILSASAEYMGKLQELTVRLLRENKDLRLQLQTDAGTQREKKRKASDQEQGAAENPSPYKYRTAAVSE